MSAFHVTTPSRKLVIWHSPSDEEDEFNTYIEDEFNTYIYDVSLADMSPKENECCCLISKKLAARASSRLVCKLTVPVYVVGLRTDFIERPARS